MESLDIILTKDSCLLLHAIHGPFYWRILNKPILFSGFKKRYKKYNIHENSSLFINSLYGKMRSENQTKTRIYEDPSLCPEILKMPFKNSISGGVAKMMIYLQLSLYNNKALVHSTSLNSVYYDMLLLLKLVLRLAPDPKILFVSSSIVRWLAPYSCCG